MRIHLPDLAATERLGAAIGRGARAGDAILLSGPLGAGKTALARALLRAACGDPAMIVPSPSYTLVQTYHADTLALHHFDLWRLASHDEVRELGWEEARAGAVIVEWPERLGPLRPAETLEIALSPAEGEARWAEIAGAAAPRLVPAGTQAAAPNAERP